MLYDIDTSAETFTVENINQMSQSVGSMPFG
jgi:hypothetical protein